MTLGCLFGHKWMGVEVFPHDRCGGCFGMMNSKGCPHSFQVCMRCGKAKGFGSHGEMTGIPDSCKKQIVEMRRGINYKGKVDALC